MKIKPFVIALILLCAGVTALAQDIFMATSEDLKEFDNLISKEKTPPPSLNGVPPANSAATPANKKKQNGQRERFQGNRPHGERPGQQPGFQQPPPPAGTEPGGSGPPPPPPQHKM